MPKGSRIRVRIGAVLCGQGPRCSTLSVHHRVRGSGDEWCARSLNLRPTNRSHPRPIQETGWPSGSEFSNAPGRAWRRLAPTPAAEFCHRCDVGRQVGTWALGSPADGRRSNRHARHRVCNARECSPRDRGGADVPPEFEHTFVLPTFPRGRGGSQRGCYNERQHVPVSFPRQCQDRYHDREPRHVQS